MTDQFARSEALSIRDRLSAEHSRYMELVSLLPMDKLRIQEDSRRYLCLRCAGFLEQMVFLVIRHYLRKTAGGPTLSFAESYFSNAPNLSPSALDKLFSRFGEQEKAALDVFLTANRKNTLGDLMSVRNPVAHGQDAGGAKLDPGRYIDLCNDFYDWAIDRYMTD